MAQRKRLEMNGVFNESAEHFEMWESPIYIYNRKEKGFQCFIKVPIDVVRHLDLNNKERVIVAIKKIDAEYPSNTGKEKT